MNEWLMLAVGVAAVAVGTLGGGPLTVAVLRWASRSSDAGRPGSALQPDDAARPGRSGDPGSGRDTDEPVLPAAGASPRGAGLRGGTWIGLLERAAITACLAAGYPAGIAIVVAVKGLGRYPELREHPDSSERFVIGTLTSMIWAAAVGALARHLITR